MVNQRLRGFVGQAMSSRRRQARGLTETFGPGAAVWSCPKSGYYVITVRGSGGSPNGGGSGGSGGAAASQARRYFAQGQTVALSIADRSAFDVDGAPSTATLPDGTVLTAGGGKSGTNGGAGGLATGGDINVSGSAAASIVGGAGATIGTNRGGAGLGRSPGAGHNGGTAINTGGDGSGTIARD